MQRTMALIERDIRKFRRSPTLMLTTMFFPLIQLVVLGYAFGGKIKNLHVGIVDQDHKIETVKLRELCGAVAANARTFDTILYGDEGAAIKDLRDGRISAILQIPPNFSRRVMARDAPQVALIEDNTDNFAVAALEGAFSQLLGTYNQRTPAPRVPNQATLRVVEVYPYVPYIQYLLPGTITLAIFISAMIGGGIIFIDDKARGLHEGYLVTPISKIELILGFTLSGAIKAFLSGLVLTTLGSIIAGIPHPLDPFRLVKLLVVIVVAALALISMMFMLMVRVNDPLVPRATFGVLNTLLYFPSGAVYPINGFPDWMRAISSVDPFTYAVHAFKELLLKDAGLGAIAFDLSFLVVFAHLMMTFATLLFKRSL
ncbi:MAG TPA: ABC transporter permease [Acidobacteriota bacterium]|nr:ABC transporter permease [Acidobacteriota bacterium]